MFVSPQALKFLNDRILQNSILMFFFFFSFNSFNWAIQPGLSFVLKSRSSSPLCHLKVIFLRESHFLQHASVHITTIERFMFMFLINGFHCAFVKIFWLLNVFSVALSKGLGVCFSMLGTVIVIFFFLQFYNLH